MVEKPSSMIWLYFTSHWAIVGANQYHEVLCHQDSRNLCAEADMVCEQIQSRPWHVLLCLSKAVFSQPRVERKRPKW